MTTNVYAYRCTTEGAMENCSSFSSSSNSRIPLLRRPEQSGNFAKAAASTSPPAAPDVQVITEVDTVTVVVVVVEVIKNLGPTSMFCS